MPAATVLADIRQLSSGTIATIARTDLGFVNATAASYSFIESLQRQFLEFAERTIETARYDSWQAAWHAYRVWFDRTTKRGNASS